MQLPSVAVSKHFCFLIVGGLYSVIALRENDQERVTVYTKHRLKITLTNCAAENGGQGGGVY